MYRQSFGTDDNYGQTLIKTMSTIHFIYVAINVYFFLRQLYYYA